MFNHAPPGYDCPFCLTVAGIDREGLWTKTSDVVAREDGATAWVAPAWWPRNEGHVIVVPDEHIENIYDLSGSHAVAVHELGRRVAISLMESYGCDGTSTRQHNGPGGDQEIWHYHLHVFPRYRGDGLYGAQRRRTTPEERQPYVAKLRSWFAGS